MIMKEIPNKPANAGKDKNSNLGYVSAEHMYLRHIDGQSECTAVNQGYLFHVSIKCSTKDTGMNDISTMLSKLCKNVQIAN